MIGLGMFYVVGRVFLDNAAGALGKPILKCDKKLVRWSWMIQT